MKRCLVLVLLAGCQFGTAPSDPFPGATPIAVNVAVVGEWNAMESCSGRVGDVHTLRLYSVPSDGPESDFTISYRGHAAYGWYFARGPRIYLSSAYATPGIVMRHEMMHALLRTTGHPRQFFDGVCGHLGGVD